MTDVWNDFVAIFLKDESLIGRYPSRILDAKKNHTNGLVHGGKEFSNFNSMPEDKSKLAAISKIISEEIKVGGSVLKSKRKLEVISKIISNEIKVS